MTWRNLSSAQSIRKVNVIKFRMEMNSDRKVGRLVQRRWTPDLHAFGGRRSRQSFTYEAYVPDPIADSNPVLSGDIAQVVVEAERDVRALNSLPAAASLEAVARQLLRQESVASSRIEGLKLSQRRLAEAIYSPDQRDVTARSVLNNISAMDEAIALAGVARPFTVADIQQIHRTLLITSIDARIAGMLRQEQNWIGGATPRDAAFIPPPEDEVPGLLEDLCSFIDRDDIPAVVQAAIVHAQFETIHPFADGNGRVGRCLIHVVLRRRDVADRYVPPVSVILATNATAYIRGLTEYRAGLVAEWCGLFAAALRSAARRAEALTDELRMLEDAWRARAGYPRRGSAADTLLAQLPAFSIVDSTTVQQIAGVSAVAARNALNHLEQARVLRQVTVGKRNRAWMAHEVFEVINAFEWDITTPEDPDETRRPAPSRRRASARLRS